jgi:hypothetical protein
MIPNHPMTFTLGWVTASVTCELTVVGNESIIKTVALDWMVGH